MSNAQGGGHGLQHRQGCTRTRRIRQSTLFLRMLQRAVVLFVRRLNWKATGTRGASAKKNAGGGARVRSHWEVLEMLCLSWNKSRIICMHYAHHHTCFAVHAHTSLSHVCAHSSPISTRHVTKLNESCMSHVRMSLVTTSTRHHIIESMHLCCENSGVATRRAWLFFAWCARAQRYISRCFGAVSAHKL